MGSDSETLRRVAEIAKAKGIGIICPYPDISKTLIPAHAWENIVFVCYSNRCLEETLDSEVVGKYLGNSMIANPHGELMVAAKVDIS